MSGAMMLDFLGNGDANYKAAHDAIIRAIETTLVDGPRTADLGGSSNTTEVGKAIAEAIKNGADALCARISSLRNSRRYSGVRRLKCAGLLKIYSVAKPSFRRQGACRWLPSSLPRACPWRLRTYASNSPPKSP